MKPAKIMWALIIAALTLLMDISMYINTMEWIEVNNEACTAIYKSLYPLTECAMNHKPYVITFAIVTVISIAVWVKILIDVIPSINRYVNNLFASRDEVSDDHLSLIKEIAQHNYKSNGWNKKTVTEFVESCFQEYLEEILDREDIEVLELKDFTRELMYVEEITKTH